ncbi:UPF0498 protein KIAA1191 [Heterocephalus glaber]|uniref:Putative monooxygenase p33MONOX n=1 Tax=Heterocephalus glaber TaxID=10181 RepID=G5C113_HETGA|nr:UPF0498 protein KIAA1191 [Heterocephalus glaber]
MASRQPEVPAPGPGAPLGKMSMPIRVCRQVFSYGDALGDPAPMTPPPKPDSGGFAVQAYREAQKPSPMEMIHPQATQMAEDPTTFKPPKTDIPVIETKKPPLRTHNLKPRGLNVVTPTGF